MKNTLHLHWPLALVLALFTALAVAFSVNTPLGEAPDEPAHFGYAQFIAKNGRLPASLNERSQAGYKATWPPLYHLLVALPIAAVGDAPPTHLKAVGDSPRRLISTNGQTIAAIIHTHDEVWPWQGIALAWHLARLLSVVLSAATVAATYAIAWKLTRRRGIATTAAAFHAFLPQYLFTASVITDDTLLILLSGLVLLTLVSLSQRQAAPAPAHWLLLGALLGLATVTKYNALPLWAVTLLWLVWPGSYPRPAGKKTALYRVVQPLVFVLPGAAITAGWWFAFAWRNFNQIDALGPLAGSLAALTAGTSDTALRALSGETGTNFRPPSDWLAWGNQLFRSFWGLFGGGGTIAYPDWVYWLLAALGALALAGLVTRRARFATHPARFIIITPLFFLLLPLLRFALSGSLVETAQGRHLFPAIAAIALALALGWQQLAGKLQTAGQNFRAAGMARSVLRFAPLLLLAPALYALPLIHAAYPPPIPLTTAPSAEAAASSFRARLAPGIELARLAPGPMSAGTLPLTLLWQATAIPPEDYLIDISLRDAAGSVIGAWRGHPVGGRYPTRAWDAGDTLRDVIRVPLLPGAAGDATLTLSLLDAAGQPAAPPVEFPAALGEASKVITTAPRQLRADGLPGDAPFSYRGTLSFALPGQTEPPRLVAPDGRAFAPEIFLPGGIAHFIVGADWASGSYHIDAPGAAGTAALSVYNRPRQFQPPPMTHRVEANFAGQLTLLGYDLPRRRAQPGDSLPLTIHLQANRTMGESLAIFNHLLDAQAVQRGGADRIPQQYYTTLLWVPGEIVSDSYTVPVDADAPPGVYWLDVGLYPTRRPEFSLPLVVNGQSIERNSVAVGPIKVGGPPPGVTVPAADPQTALNVTFGDEITLLGYSWGVAAAGEPPRLRLYWQAETQPAADYTVFVHVVGADGTLLAQADAPPAGGAYPTSLWDAGEIIADERAVPLPQEDDYSVWVGLYQPDSGQRLPLPGFADGALEIDPR